MILCSLSVKVVGQVENQARISKLSIAAIAIRVLFFLFIQISISSASNIIQKKELLSMLTPGWYNDNETNVYFNAAYNTNLWFLYSSWLLSDNLPKY
jgi:hypothetical protein